MSSADPVIQELALGAGPWPTVDPFLFCVHHLDAYPRANGRFGPDADLTGRSIGSDFSGLDGWSMYHGELVPGFPQHPHRGFETVTFVRSGLVDHADSIGAAARYGQGDVQWMTAGAGIVHSEMFPLLRDAADNPLDLFQIWINLPAQDKMVEPFFEMFWAPDIPRVVSVDDHGRATEVTVVAGRIGETHPLAPPPHSWASRPDSDLAIWSVRLDPDARTVLPPAERAETIRVAYVLHGPVAFGTRRVAPGTAVVVRRDDEVILDAGSAGAEILVLQGRPIGEPVAQYGPFVMNDEAGVRKAVDDYQRTGFGGWPWNADEPVHGGEGQRFARRPDGRVERATAGFSN